MRIKSRQPWSRKPELGASGTQGNKASITSPTTRYIHSLHLLMLEIVSMSSTMSFSPILLRVI